jgi:hypothetical protein
MDGINPTLAFAAIFFGLSANARDTVNDQRAQVEIESASGCPAVIMAASPQQLPSQEQWAREFWDTAATGSTSPGANWMDSALVGMKGPGDPAPIVEVDGSDPIMRQVVPADTNVQAADVGTGPCRPQP